ncbi:MAG: MFS transporter [Oscillatoriales cyanobacterium RM2_1_1]|nr:MFS transporter [Oscillatoriales cyanobacterium SM2_3_0]NJO46679.1 MFS transporter [Oscillatoriales cyanobacterium RM2_1_1]
MQVFLIVWLGQVISLLGTAITDVALRIWVTQTTGSVTQFALVLVFMSLPGIVIAPFAGSLIDRWNRRWALILSDSIKAITVFVMMILVTADQMKLWHIYIAISVVSACMSIQWPAYFSAISQLVQPRELTRANGMVQISKAFALIMGSLLAGFLVEAIQVQGVLLLDFITYIIALITLFSVKFPEVVNTAPRKTVTAEQIWQETLSGWQYVVKQPGLLQLLILMAMTYLTNGIVQVGFMPLVLSFASSSSLGIVLALSACGMLLGSIAVSTWGGLKNRIQTIILFVLIQGVCLGFGGLQPALWVITLGGFGYLFSQPVVVSNNQTIWQSKVPIDLQGRVFALQTWTEKISMIVAQLGIGLLIDYLFEPLMATDGALAPIFGPVLGAGKGRGIALLIILVGLGNILVSLIASQTPRLRRIEQEIPDAIVAH